MYEHYNVRHYVLWRDGYTCQCCGAKAAKNKVVKRRVLHLTNRKTCGNAPDNLLTLYKNCHDAYHSGRIVTVGKRTRKPTRNAAFIRIMRKTLLSRLRQELQIPVAETKGYTNNVHQRKATVSSEKSYQITTVNFIKLPFQKADIVSQTKHQNMYLVSCCLIRFVGTDNMALSLLEEAMVTLTYENWMALSYIVASAIRNCNWWNEVAII